MLDRLFKNDGSPPLNPEYQNGQVIFAQGEVADALYRVERGFVKLAVVSPRQRRVATFILRAGDCFGEGCLVVNSLRPCTATSIQQSSISRVSKRTALRRVHSEPALAKSFVAYLVLRISRAHDDFVAQLTSSSEKRLARLLLQLSDFGMAPGRAPVVIHIDQGTLALVVGTTRSRVSHFMNSFRKRGFIDYNGGLKVNRSLQTFLRDADN